MVPGDDTEVANDESMSSTVASVAEFPDADSSRSDDENSQLTTAATLATETLLAELERRQAKESSQEWARPGPPRGEWAYPIEASLSETAVACAELAATGMHRAGLCLASFKGEGNERIEMESLKRRVEALSSNLRKITEVSHSVMQPTLYTDVGIDGLVADFATFTTALRDQRRRKALDDGTVNIKPLRNFEPVRLPDTEVVWLDTQKCVAEMIDAIMYWVDIHTTTTIPAHSSYSFGLQSEERAPLATNGEPLLAIDIEGVGRRRRGDISILQICLTELNTCFLIDVFTLR